MAHWKWRMCCAAIAAAALSLAGCPPDPVLFVSPLAVDFGASSTTGTFRIQNAGGGVLSWKVTEDLPWLSVVENSVGKQGVALEGTTGPEIDVIEMRVDRAALGSGVSNGQVRITSNGGDQVVAVSAKAAASAQLQVSTTTLDLGESLTTAQFTIANLGLETLEWELAVAQDAPWLSASPVEGTLASQDAAAPVTVTVDRTGLPPGSFEGVISITSNGGDAEVTVAVDVPVLIVLPDSIAFGALASPTSRLASVQNRGFDPIAWAASASTNDGGDWLAVSPASGLAPGDATNQVGVTANPAGLAPGAYSGEVVVTAAAAGFAKTIPVTMTVTGFLVSSSAIDFGVIEAETNDTFTLTNIGTAPIAWEIQTPTAAAWLNVSPVSGSLTGTETITVTANPAVVQPGPYEADISILHNDVTDVVHVTMTRPAPPALVVAPTEIDFATTRIEQTLAIWNSGTGTVGWRIDTSGFPAWLSLTPVDGAGIASGTVAGEETAILALRVDRALAPAGELNFTHAFQVEAVSGATGSVDVLVHMAIPVVPRIDVEADGFDSTGVPFVNLDTDENSATFQISNLGNGGLFWSISGQEQAPWITSVSPAQGTLEPNTQVTVTLSADRSTLTYLGAQHLLTITSNDPDNGGVLLLVEIQVEKMISIGVRPTQMGFGVDVISDILEIANFGDPDTILNFAITSNKEWLNVFPDSGTSIGVLGSLKNWQPVSVSVDRSLIESNGASGKLAISAFEVVDGQRVPLPNIAPIEVAVSVEAVELVIESAPSRLRVPSLVRTVLLMRNIRQHALPIPDALLREVAGKFTLYENGEVLEITETNQFLRNSSRIRANVLIILDYSGSMLASAREALEEDIATAGDPIQALYESCIPQLIEELPGQYRVALAVMSERVGDAELSSLRLLGGDDGEEIFTTNKDILQARLFALDVNDNGATTLLPSLRQAAQVLLNEDLNRGLIPFDDADMRAIIAVTDGRLTTSSNFNIIDTAQFLVDRNVRYMPIGWGSQVYGDPLIRLSALTGGHYYATRNVPTGETDAFGNAIRIPVAANLQAWCETDLGDECDQSVPKDLKAQVLFSYTTLKNEPGVTVEGRLTFNEPNDQNSPCLEEQGEITGSYTHAQLDFEGIAGDPRLGQISLRSEGLRPDGTARVVARLEYAPRNVRRLAFSLQVDSAEAYSVDIAKIAESSGGVFPAWNQSGGIGNLVFATPDDMPLEYGDFGDMFELRFSNVTQPFLVRVAVTDPVIVPANPESKYFTIPDTISVYEADSFAPAFPTPLLSAVPAITVDEEDAHSIDLGTAVNAAQIFIWNGGGSHAPTGVWLDWALNIEEGSSLVRVVPDPPEGTVVSTLSPDTVTVTVDRSVDPGEYEVVIGFVYVYGSLGITYTGAPLTLFYTVAPALLAVSNTLFAFGDSTVDLPISVSNTGQSVLRWSINTATLPSWLSVTANSGALGPGESDDFLVHVQRDAAPGPGDYTHSFLVQTEDGQSISLTATMTVNP